MLSRTRRYEAMRLNQRTKRVHTRRKFLIGFFSLLTMTAVSTKLSLADADVAGLVESWFQRKAEIVISDMDRHIQLETGIQKQRLMKEIEFRMAAADESMNRFSMEQKSLYKNSLQSYADQLIANMDFSNEEEKKRIESALEPILSSARAAMDDLAQNYTPPAVEKPVPMPAPEPTEEAPPAAETPAPNEPAAPPVATEEPAPTEAPAAEQPDVPAATEEPAADFPAPASEIVPTSDADASAAISE